MVAASLALVAGCQTADPSATTDSGSTSLAPAATCAELAVRIVDAVQDYVDSFATSDASAVTGLVTAGQGDFAAVTEELRARGEELACDPEDLAAGIREELGRLVGGTPVQDAIAATFRSGPLGTSDPSDPGAVQVTVRTAEELVAALAVVGSGSTIRLLPGDFVLSAPLVALRPVTLVGAGDGTVPGEAASTITSTAAEGALVVATDGDMVVRDLHLVHSGTTAASVILVAGGGYLFERVQVSGGVTESGAGGYGIVLRPSTGPLTAAGETQVLRDVVVSGSPAGGVVVAGSQEPTMTGVTVTGTDGCGLCWVESSGGRASASTVTGTQVGVRIDDAAAPSVSDVTVSATQVGIGFTGTGAPRLTANTLTGNATGIQVTGDGAAVFSGNAVADSIDVGIRISGPARATFTDTAVSGATRVGVAVVGNAAPTITGGRVATTGEVGLIWAESARGRATGVTVAGSRLALQLSDDSAPTIERFTVESASVGSLLANGRSGGTVSGLACSPGDGAAVALAEQTTVALTGSAGCQVVDER